MNRNQKVYLYIKAFANPPKPIIRLIMGYFHMNIKGQIGMKVGLDDPFECFAAAIYHRNDKLLANSCKYINMSEPYITTRLVSYGNVQLIEKYLHKFETKALYATLSDRNIALFAECVYTDKLTDEQCILKYCHKGNAAKIWDPDWKLEEIQMSLLVEFDPNKRHVELFKKYAKESRWSCCVETLRIGNQYFFEYVNGDLDALEFLIGCVFTNKTIALDFLEMAKRNEHLWQWMSTMNKPDDYIYDYISQRLKHDLALFAGETMRSTVKNGTLYYILKRLIKD